MTERHDDYASCSMHYSDANFWTKLRLIPRSAGRVLLLKALLLRELLISPGVPIWVRAAILGVLGYLILPLDAVPDVLPVVGYADDVAAMTALLGNVNYLVSDDMRGRAEERLTRLLGGGKESP